MKLTGQCRYSNLLDLRLDIRLTDNEYSWLGSVFYFGCVYMAVCFIKVGSKKARNSRPGRQSSSRILSTALQSGSVHFHHRRAVGHCLVPSCGLRELRRSHHGPLPTRLPRGGRDARVYSSHRPLLPSARTSRPYRSMVFHERWATLLLEKLAQPLIFSLHWQVSHRYWEGSSRTACWSVLRL